ncbi:MAG: metalloregulator ArsR/SmtB family transcription factor [Isosphaeraceae bacterium]
MAAASPKSSATPKKSSASPKSGGKSPKAAAPARPAAEIRRVADLLKQVSDPTRLQVLMLLSEKERNVSELCADLGTQSQPAVSHHLALLRHGRLIEPRRSGKHNFYGLTDAGRELAKVVRSVVG